MPPLFGSLPALFAQQSAAHTDNSLEMVIERLPAILSIVLIFGGWVVYASIKSVSENRRAARVAEQNAVLKKEMIDKGFSADEIVKVLEAGGGADKKGA